MILSTADNTPHEKWLAGHAMRRLDSAMIITFLYALASGVAIVLATCNPQQIAWKFHRLSGILVLALAVPPTAWLWQNRSATDASFVDFAVVLGAVTSLGAMGMMLLAPLIARIPTIFRSCCIVAGGAGLVSAAIMACAGKSFSLGLNTLVVVNELLAAMLLGSITVAWLLGHAYLTATKMTIAPMQHFSKMLLLSISARAMFTIISLGIAYAVGGDAAAQSTPTAGVWVMHLLQNQWIIITLRLGLGVVAVGIFAYMVSDCVRLRATQSATGILYFGSIFAYVGELANQHLIAECGWPI